MQLVSIALSLGLAAIPAELLPPPGDHRVELMVPVLDQKRQAILLKLQAAAATDPAWFKEWMRKRERSGELPPYDPKAGITEDEHKSMRAAEVKFTLVKTAEATVRIEKLEDKTVVSFVDVTNDFHLAANVFQLSADGKSMTCDFGTTSDRGDVDVTDENAMLGAWRGVRWTLHEGNSGPREVRMDRMDPSKTNSFSLELAVGIDGKNHRVVVVRGIGRRHGQPLDTAVIARWPKES